MIFLYAIIVLAICIFSSIGIDRFFDYKKTQLEYEKVNGEQTTEISVKALALEIEKENTKQMELDADAFKEKEHTRQYEIKTNYRNKYHERLY